MIDRQLERWVEARAEHHKATQHLRRAQAELDGAASELATAGQALADRVRTRHRTVVDLLIAVGVPTEAAESDAEGIEHHVSDQTLQAFQRFLTKP